MGDWLLQHLLTGEMRPGSARRLTAAVFAAIWSGQENAYVQALKVDLQPCIVANGALVSSSHCPRPDDRGDF